MAGLVKGVPPLRFQQVCLLNLLLFHFNQLEHLAHRARGPDKTGGGHIELTILILAKTLDVMP